MRRALPFVLALLVTAGCGGDAQHRFTVTVSEATNVVEGQAIRMAGVPVGRVTGLDAVDGGRRVRLGLELDDAAWPLPKGTKMALRWGGTVNFSDRYIVLDRGRGPGRAVEEGGAFPAADFTVPVEADELLAAFPRRSRRELSRFLTEAGPALDASSRGLRGTVRRGPAALAQASAVLQDLDADQVALDTLVRAADDVTGAVTTAQPQLRELVTGAAGTFDAIALEARSLQDGMQAAPGTLRTARVLLRRADPTLDRARRLVRRLRPGVAELHRTAEPLDALLGAVRTAGPDARATLATARASVPDVRGLLGRLRTLTPQVDSTGKQAVKALECIRPFTPDVVAFFTNWGDFLSGGDGKDKILRAQVQQMTYAPGNALPYGTDTLAKLTPGLEYGFPRPPGTNAGQPWFLPECGAGPDALDPQKDPEIRPTSKLFEIPKLVPIVRAPKEPRR